jgi:WD40 repeat protein/serine/threonine protein kinase
MTLKSGQLIKGYEIVDELGIGGFGAVYRAHQQLLKRDVAIKIILPEHANKADFIRRFTTEAEIVARLEHPHIVPIYDYWRDPEGAYIIMRYIKGVNLATKLMTRDLSESETVKLIDHISSALHFAHRKQVVHRDLKPENILVDDDGNAYLVDFGIAKDLSQTSDQENEGAGTFLYMSPEQLTGESITPQTDIYALGLLIYEILTGNLPHARTTPHALKQLQFDEELPHDDNHPSDVLEILHRATSLQPENRFESALSLASRLRLSLLGAAGSLVSTATAEATDLESAELDEPVELLNPYKGLFAFQEADRNDFYGREKLVNRLLNQLRQPADTSRFIALVGPSGSGKSSVVKAGLLPQIRADAVDGSENWFIADMYPGSHPFDELEVALTQVSVRNITSLNEELTKDEQGLVRALDIVLPPDDSRLLLIIDQFEELFTMVEDEATRLAFLESIIAAINEPQSRIHIIITLRIDFYDKPLHYQDFGDLLRKQTTMILPMSDQELEHAIRKPAQNVGAEFEAGLVDAIIHDVSNQPGMLPLLQYALVQLFERRNRRVLVFSAYLDMDGVTGALATTADDIYANLTPTEQEGVRQLMLRLVSVGEGTKDTRRRVRRDELESISELETVLDILGFARLLTFDYEPDSRLPTVEIAHEALIRTWQLYQMWVDDNRDELRIQRSLTRATREWLDSGEDPGFLAESARLAQFELWQDYTNLGLSADEQDFLNQSLAVRDERQRMDEARKEHELILQRQAANRLRIILGVVTISLIIVSLLGVWGFQSAIIAQEQAGTAEAARSDSEQNEQRAVVAESTAVQQSYEANTILLSSRLSDVEQNNPFLAYGLSLNLLETDRDIPISVRANVNRFLLNSRAVRIFGEHDDWINAIDISANGSRIATGSQDKTVRIWDTATTEELTRLNGHSGWVTAVAISTDGRRVLSGDSHHNIILWDVETANVIFELTGHQGTINELKFAPDGRTALSASNDTTLKLWDLDAGSLLNTLEWHEQRVTDVEYLPDGRNALSSGDDGMVILWDIQMGRPNRIFGGHESEVSTVAVSPDGRYAISGGQDNIILQWEITNFQTSDPVRRFEGHEQPLRRIVFSPDGQTMLSTSWDETLILWDFATGQAIDVLQGHKDWVNDVVFSSDNQTAISASRDRTLILWDIANREYDRVWVHNAPVYDIALSANSDRALTASGDNQIVLWNTAINEILNTFEGHTQRIQAIKLLPDGRTFLSGSYDETVVLWDMNTGEKLKIFGDPASENAEILNGVNWFSIAPDGKTFLSAREGDLTHWDLETGEKLLQIDRSRNLADGHFHAVEFMPDGSRALSTLGNDLVLWNLETGEAIRYYTGHTDTLNGIAVSPDYKSVVTTSNDQSLILWDIETGVALRTFTGHTAFVGSASFAPDGRTIISVSTIGEIILWDVATGEPLRIFVGHDGGVYTVIHTSDGNSFLTGGEDGTVKIWQLWLANDALIQWAQDNRQIIQPSCDDLNLYRSPNRNSCLNDRES